MSDRTEFVDYQEPIGDRIQTYLLSRGYMTANVDGVACGIRNARYIGILHRNPHAQPLRYLFGLIKVWPPDEFIGVLFFKEDKECGATEQRWVFEAYGRKHHDLVTRLAEDMASTFDVKILIRLVREERVYERSPWYIDE